MKWENKLLVVSVVFFILAFPITSAYIEAGVDTVLNYWMEYKIYLLPSTVLYAIGWGVYKTRTKVNIPKNKKSKAKYIKT